MNRIILLSLVVICIAAGLIFGSVPATAQAQSPARQALEKTVNKILQALNQPEINNPATRDRAMDQVEEIIADLFSFEELSMRTVGPSWKTFNKDQKTRFIDSFRKMLRASYARTFEEYDGETLTYNSEESIGSNNDRVQLNTSITSKGKHIPLDFRMINKGGWKVYDLVIEGVGLVQNYRSQFHEIMQKGDPEALIKLVDQKTAQIK
jgi:phospholipid transport system substrate-binding protein